MWTHVMPITSKQKLEPAIQVWTGLLASIPCQEIGISLTRTVPSALVPEGSHRLFLQSWSTVYDIKLVGNTTLLFWEATKIQSNCYHKAEHCRNWYHKWGATLATTTTTTTKKMKNFGDESFGVRWQAARKLSLEIGKMSNHITSC